MNLAVITCTADRPDAFKTCKHWMLRQKRKPEVWIVADGGLTTADTTGLEGMEVLHVQSPASTPGTANFLDNMQLALDSLPRDHAIAIMEDDDWYAPQHLANIEKHLSSGADAVGSEMIRYWHKGAKATFEFSMNQVHILASVAMRAEFVHCLRTAVYSSKIAEDHRVDVRLRTELMAARASIRTAGGTCVGVKGWNGSRGIGMGHNPDFYDRRRTRGNVGDFNQLVSWVGRSDAERIER